MAGSGKRRATGRRVMFALEMLLLFLFLGVLFVYGQITSRIERLETPQVAEFNESPKYTYDEAKIAVNETAPVMTGYRTYAIFGLDHRSKNEALDAENSDTIIIVSINNDTKDVKMVSVYRDTLLNIGNDTYTKANAAYAYGGPVQAISMLNTNLDLKITDYISVDFNAVVNLVDAVGGIEVPLSYAEIVHLNNYCQETAQETGKTYTPISLPEPAPEDQEAIIDLYHLNGVQATSYCRIRYTASLDMGRTERQRRVIQLVTNKLKKTGLTRLLAIADEVLPLVRTSLNATEILQMVPTLIGYSLNDTTGFPSEYKFSDVKGSIIVADTLETNVTALHRFLYGEDVVYYPSAGISNISQRIISIVGGEEQLLEQAPVVTGDPADTSGDFIWVDSADNGGYETTWSEYSSTFDNSSGGSYTGTEGNTSYVDETGNTGYTDYTGQDTDQSGENGQTVQEPENTYTDYPAQPGSDYSETGTDVNSGTGSETPSYDEPSYTEPDNPSGGDLIFEGGEGGEEYVDSGEDWGTDYNITYESVNDGASEYTGEIVWDDGGEEDW